MSLNSVITKPVPPTYTATGELIAARLRRSRVPQSMCGISPHGKSVCPKLFPSDIRMSVSDPSGPRRLFFGIPAHLFQNPPMIFPPEESGRLREFSMPGPGLSNAAALRAPRLHIQKCRIKAQPPAAGFSPCFARRRTRETFNVANNNRKMSPCQKI